MSRIGKKEIPLPKGVEARHEDNVVTVKGPKGSLRTPIVQGIDVKVENNVVSFTRKDDEGKTRAFDIVGVGYRAEVKGKEVVFQLGYSHPVRFAVPAEIDIVVDAKSGHITITGIDKQKVGQTAAEIRSLREPDPYKGKGIKYSDEIIRRKAGKAAGK